MTEAVETKEKRVVILNPQRMGTREERRQDWAANAEVGTTIEDVLDPQYFSHMAQHFEPFARIEVLEETGAWMLELLVINYGRNWAQVHVLARHDLAKRVEKAPASTKHKVENKGAQLKWCVIRLADSEVLQSGMRTEQAAGEWLTSYERSVGP